MGWESSGNRGDGRRWAGRVRKSAATGVDRLREFCNDPATGVDRLGEFVKTQRRASIGCESSAMTRRRASQRPVWLSFGGFSFFANAFDGRSDGVGVPAQGHDGRGAGGG
jgi:uncharacterized protein (DUF3084 family)